MQCLLWSEIRVIVLDENLLPISVFFHFGKVYIFVFKRVPGVFKVGSKFVISCVVLLYFVDFFRGQIGH